MGYKTPVIVDTLLFNRLVEALRDVETYDAEGDKISLVKAVKRLNTTAAKLRAQVDFAVRYNVKVI